MKGEGEEEEGAAEPDAMGGRLIPSAPGGSLLQWPPPAVRGCSELAHDRCQAGRRSRLLPPRSSPDPTAWSCQGWSFNTSVGANLGFQKRLSLTFSEMWA